MRICLTSLKAKLAIAITSLCLVSTVDAAVISELESMNILTMIESSLATVTTISDYQSGVANITSPTTFSGTYNNSGFGYSVIGEINGQAYSLSLNGILTGSLGSDISIAVSGSGFIGSQPITVDTESIFFYNGIDYVQWNIQQLTKIESNSFWGWVCAAEAIGGGVIGGAAGVAGGVIATAGTGGLGVGLGVALAAGGALGGASAAVGLSAGVKSLVEDPVPPPPPPLPPQPTYPADGTPLSSGSGKVVSGVTATENSSTGMSGGDLTGKVGLYGGYSSGGFSGNITNIAIPETSTFLLTLISGMAASGSIIISRRLARNSKST